MPMQYSDPIAFTLKSVEHDGAVLLDSKTTSMRSLLGENHELQTPTELELEFSYNGKSYKELLKRTHGAFAADASVTLLGENGKEEVVELPETYAYYSENREWVLTFTNDNRFEGVYVNDSTGEMMHFVGNDGQLQVDSTVHELFGGADALKGRNLKQIDFWSGCYPGQSSSLTEVSVGALSGFELFNTLGTTGSRNAWNTAITLSNTIYERQMQISLVIGQNLVATAASAAPWTYAGCTASITTQLNNLRTWSKPSTRAIWHILDDCFNGPANSGTLGVAYLNGLCNSGTNTGVNYYTENLSIRNSYPTWTTVAHEIGHNFGAAHSFELGQGRTGGIMDYGPINNRLIGGEVQFNTRFRRSEVCAEITRSINGNCNGISRTAAIETSTPLVVNKEVEMREIECVQHRNKRTTEATIISETYGGDNVESCKDSCAADKFCDSFTFVEDTGMCQLMNSVEGGMIHASGYDTFTCDTSANDSSLDDILGDADAEDLINSCCSVEAGKTYAGLNMRMIKEGSFASCADACVKDTACASMTFDSVENNCMMWSNEGGLYEPFADKNSVAMDCNRECIASEVAPVKELALLPVVGAVAAVSALIAGVAFVVYKKRAASN